MLRRLQYLSIVFHRSNTELLEFEDTHSLKKGFSAGFKLVIAVAVLLGATVVALTVALVVREYQRSSSGTGNDTDFSE